MSASLFYRCLLTALFCAVLVVGMAPAGAAEELADLVVVKKSERKLYLYSGEKVLRSFDIALGLVPDGPKMQEGDFRTPEGSYKLDRRRVDSDFFMAIQISYPNEVDSLSARSRGVDPGSYIMIHGQPVNPKKPPSYYQKYDWTNGCIAVSNAAMIDIWQLTAANTPIEILP